MNNLRSVRRQKRIAQMGVAAKAGVSPSMVSAVERWDYKPSEDVCERIARALDVDVEAIWPDLAHGTEARRYRSA